MPYARFVGRPKDGDPQTTFGPYDTIHDLHKHLGKDAVALVLRETEAFDRMREVEAAARRRAIRDSIDEIERSRETIANAPIGLGKPEWLEDPLTMDRLKLRVEALANSMKALELRQIDDIQRIEGRLEVQGETMTFINTKLNNLNVLIRQLLDRLMPRA